CGPAHRAMRNYLVKSIPRRSGWTTRPGTQSSRNQRLSGKWKTASSRCFAQQLVAGFPTLRPFGALATLAAKWTDREFALRDHLVIEAKQFFPSASAPRTRQPYAHIWAGFGGWFQENARGALPTCPERAQ